MVRFLNSTVQAMAIVHEGIIYGTIARLLIMFLPGISVRTTSQAIIAPRKKANSVAPAETTSEFRKGV